MSRVAEKVTAFITRGSGERREMLLLEHPHAGIQIPAGTVEEGESPEQAVMREAAEETGLTRLTIHRYLGCVEETLSQGHRLIAEPTKVYARPDATSFDWAHLRRGILVTLTRRSQGFSQVTYQEFDRLPDPQYVTMCITGWVPDGALADTTKRYFYHLESHGCSEERWVVRDGHHLFTLFWAPLAGLPEIIHPQDEWLKLLYRSLDQQCDHG